MAFFFFVLLSARAVRAVPCGLGSLLFIAFFGVRIRYNRFSWSAVCL